MGVGDVESVISCGITVNCNFFNAVLDLTSAIVLGKVFESKAPAVFCGNVYCSDHLAVYYEVYGDNFGTDTVLIIVIVPGLVAGNFCGFGNMGVGYVESVVGGCITVYCYFLNAVLDLNAVFKLRKIFKGEAPAVFCGNGDGIYNLTVCKKLNGDGVGTDAVLVVCVVPDLVAGYVDRDLVCVNVGNLNVDSVFLILVIGVFCISVTVGGIILTVFKAGLFGVYEYLVLKCVNVGTHKRSVLEVPCNAVDGAVCVTFNVRATCRILGLGYKLNYNGCLIFAKSFANPLIYVRGVVAVCILGAVFGIELCYNVSVSVNYLDGFGIKNYPLAHVVGYYNVIVWMLSEIGDSALQSVCQSADAVRLNVFDLIDL